MSGRTARKATKKKTSFLYNETAGDNQEPSTEDINEQARRLGVDLEKEPKLLSLVKESITSQVPQPWKPCYDATKKAWYYYNTETYKSQWDHPADALYKEKIKDLREKLAMHRMQTLDMNVTKPPKSLPPLKKPGAAKGLPADGMPQLKELKKLGPIPNSMASTGDPLRAGLRALSLNPSALKPLGQTMMSSPMNMKPAEPEMSSDRRQLSSSLRDSSGYDSVMQQNSKSNSTEIGNPPKKLGLTLTGAGSAFMKRDPSKSETLDDNSDLSISDAKSPATATKTSITSPPDSVVAGKPFKSILVKSNSLRSQNQTDMKWNVDLDSLKDDEKLAWDQMESQEKRSTAVKFKLDENTELHFETSVNENEEDYSSESKDTTADESETEESEDDNVESEVDILPMKEAKDILPIKETKDVLPIKETKEESPKISPRIGSSKISTTSEKSSSNVSNITQGERPSSTAEHQNTLSKPQPAVNILENRLGTINQPKPEARRGKTLEETIEDLNIERQQDLKRVQDQLEKQKAKDLARAKEEIEHILKLEMDKIKLDFQVKIQTKKEELIEQYNKELNESIESLKIQHEQQIAYMKSNHLAAMEKLKAQTESEFQLEKASLREQLRREFEEEKDEIKRKLVIQNEIELNKLKAELENKKHSLEAEFQNSLEDLQKEMSFKMKSANNSATSMQEEEALIKNREMKEHKFKAKYERLEAKYDSLKKQIKLLVESQTLNKMPSKESFKRSTSIPSNLPQMVLSLSSDDGRKKHSRGDDHDDSANESDSDHSLHSSDGDLDYLNEGREENEGDHEKDGSSRERESRLYSALKSLDDIRQQILALTQERQLEKFSPVPANSPEKPAKSSHKARKYRSSLSNFDQNSPNAPNLQHAEKSKQRMELPLGDSVVSRPGDIQNTPNKDLVEEAKDFIRTQRHRLGKQQANENFVVAPIQTTFGVKQRLAMEKFKAERSPLAGSQYFRETSKSIPPFLNGEHREMSETESSGVGSWKDQQSRQKRKVSQEIDHICRSLTALDGQMKEVWTMVKAGAGDNLGDQFSTRLQRFQVDETGKKIIPTNISLGVRTLNVPERKNYHGAVEQMKKMWNSTLQKNDSTENLPHYSHGDSFTHPGGDSNSAYSYPNVLPNSLHSVSYGVNDHVGQNPLMSLNPGLLQPMHFNSALNSLIPGGGAVSVESLDEEIKHFKERQAQLVNQYAPYSPPVTTPETLHEKTKHLREWLDKF